ncbi:MAG: hypothetical protein WBQ62_04920 [Dehalococcoidales bacterium]
MTPELTKEPTDYQWALPENLDIPRDELKIRLDFYGQSVVLYVLENGIVTTKMVSPQDVALALLRDVPLGSGVLPENTLWWQHRQDGAPVVALWRPPQVWPLGFVVSAKSGQPGGRFYIVPNPELLAKRRAQFCKINTNESENSQ